jgi:hypothetical protein
MGTPTNVITAVVKSITLRLAPRLTRYPGTSAHIPPKGAYMSVDSKAPSTPEWWGGSVAKTNTMPIAVRIATHARYALCARCLAQSTALIAMVAIEPTKKHSPKLTLTSQEDSKRLTVKLRGRAQAPDWSRGCKLSFRTRGHTTDSHGPLQRLLDPPTEL